jgi:hypothetical protein
VLDLRRVERRLLGWVQDGERAAAGGRGEVMRERRDAATAWRVGGDEGDVNDEVLLSGNRNRDCRPGRWPGGRPVQGGHHQAKQVRRLATMANRRDAAG